MTTWGPKEYTGKTRRDLISGMVIGALIATGAIKLADRSDSYAFDQSQTDAVIGAVTAGLESNRRNPYLPSYYDARWLTQAGGPVVLVFGYIDNLENCQIIRDAMVEGSRPSRTDYECILAR